MVCGVTGFAVTGCSHRADLFWLSWLQALTAVALLCGGDYDVGAAGIGPTQAIRAVQAVLATSPQVRHLSHCESCYVNADTAHHPKPPRRQTSCDNVQAGKADAVELLIAASESEEPPEADVAAARGCTRCKRCGTSAVSGNTCRCMYPLQKSSYRGRGV